MTTGTGLQNLYDSHYMNAKNDNAKFKSIKSVVQKNPRLTKTKIWLTLMTLNRELGDRFDLFDVGRSHFLNAQNIYTMKGLICEADVLQFYDETNDQLGLFGFQDLGHEPGCISITQDLENFYIALLRKTPRKQFHALVRNELNMFHFRKLYNWQRKFQELWLKKNIRYLNECSGNMFDLALLLKVLPNLRSSLL